MRFLDFTAGALGLPTLGLPLALFWLMGLRFTVERTSVVGQGARLFVRSLLTFRPSRLSSVAERLGLVHFLDCLSLLRGDLALVGPRPLPPLEPHAVASYRVAVKPGLVSPFALQEWSGAPHASEADVDYEYTTLPSFKSRLALLARSLRASARREPKVSPLNRIDVDGVRIDNLSVIDSVKRIVEFLGETALRHVSFVSAERINRAAHDASYRHLLRSSDLVLGAGRGVQMFSRLIGQPLRENVKERELFPRLCEALEGTHDSVYLLGGAPGVAGAVATWIQSRYFGCRIAGFDDGWFDASEEPMVIRDIARSGATLLVVAFQAPDQERWLRDHLAATGARVGIGMGGLFDALVGGTPRPPSWTRRLRSNLEFFVRTVRAAFRERILPVRARRAVQGS
jgi:N-acetylglucosaminyldiphosphoundecaprenol N-acetyl-beta-D-mannosaminyltransferase